MRITKSEMVAAINKVKSVIPKQHSIPAFTGALVKDGYLIATNLEIAVQVKLDVGEGEKFILPAKAMDMICKLPEGDIVIEEREKNRISITAGKIKHQISTYDVDTFTYDDIRDTGQGSVTIDAEQFLPALASVSFAADTKSVNALMRGVYIKGNGDGMKLVALDGHRIAMNRITAEGMAEREVIIPKEACSLLASLGLKGKLEFWNNEYSAIFKADDCVVYTRLISGQYFAYEQMLKHEDGIRVSVDRSDFSDALARAYMCITSDTSKTPVILDITAYDMEVSVLNSVSVYKETLPVANNSEKPIRIGFNPKLINETLRYFTDDLVEIELTDPKMPMFISEDGTELSALVLPVAIHDVQKEENKDA